MTDQAADCIHTWHQPRPSRVGARYSRRWETACRCMSLSLKRQATRFVVSELLHVSGLRIRGGWARDNPVPCAPGFSRVAREADSITGRRSASTPCRTRKRPAAVCRSKALPVRSARPARPRPSRVGVPLLSSTGNSSLPCRASSPCGACIVARCPFSEGRSRSLGYPSRYCVDRQQCR